MPKCGIRKICLEFHVVKIKKHFHIMCIQILQFLFTRQNLTFFKGEIKIHKK